jgi:hypothetical protein|tara:strand:+ start:428 stop:616 length:189 start_codon:yes stop_codon:yes gene_type:complete
MGEEKKEEGKKSKDKYELAEMPTKTKVVIVDREGEEGKNAYDEMRILVRIANDLDKIKKSLD